MSITKTNRFTTKSLLASAISTALLTLSTPSQAQSFTEFIQQGDVIAELRVRGENVQDDAATEDAVAMTARARIGYETASMAGFKVLAEYDQVVILQDEYESKSSTGPNNPGRAAVVDGRGGDFNRAQISYSHDLAKAVLGRQRIIFDNARFIGNVGWRQNEQTFDAARIDFTGVKNLSASYVYVDQRNTITYQDIAVEDHLLNLGYTTPVGKVSAYGYLLKEDDTDKTYDTFGVRFKGKAAASDTINILYTAEYATQTYNSGVAGSKDFDADYGLIEAGVNVAGVSLLAGLEALNGDGDYAFSTPYATGHAFNGWADKFLATPKNGLTDTYAKAVGKVAGVKLIAVYHDFSSDENGDDLGSEINLLAGMKYADNLSVGVKYADYSEGDEAYAKRDTQKFWLWAEAKF